MAIRLKTIRGQNIIVEDTPLASPGAEGSVHRITSPITFKHDCVKIYFKKIRKERESKVQYMAYNPPAELQGKNYRICWVKEAIFEVDEFAGFIMPLAYPDSIHLYDLCTARIKKDLGNIWHQRYDRTTKKGIEARFKLCVNIASAIHAVHSMQRYVVVDMKPQNILITDDGKVSLVDCDSFQIVNNGKKIFSAPLITPGYVPYEGNQIKPSTHLIPESWDMFSLAIIYYELIFGLHPYAASFSGEYESATNIADKIKNDLFVHGAKKKYISFQPPLHKNFNSIPISIQQLFHLVFQQGHQNPQIRPNAEDWGRTINSELKKVKNNQFKGFNHGFTKDPTYVPFTTPQVSTKPQPVDNRQTATQQQTSRAKPNPQISQATGSISQKRPGSNIGSLVSSIVGVFAVLFIVGGALLIGIAYFASSPQVSDSSNSSNKIITNSSVSNVFRNINSLKNVNTETQNNHHNSTTNSISNSNYSSNTNSISNSNYSSSNTNTNIATNFPTQCKAGNIGYLTVGVRLRSSEYHNQNNVLSTWKPNTKVKIIQVVEGEKRESKSESRYWCKVEIKSGNCGGCDAEDNNCGKEYPECQSIKIGYIHEDLINCTNR
jgi:hypothetical protein